MPNASLKDLSLSLIELKAIAKIRDIKGYESMSKDKLLCTLKPSESEKNFDKTRIENIREELKKLGRIFSKSEIKEIRKSLYEIENKKNLSASRKKEIKENLLELENKLSRLKMYYDKDEYKGIRSIRIYLICPRMKIIISQ